MSLFHRWLGVKEVFRRDIIAQPHAVFRYGRDISINEDGHLAPGGYIVQTGDLKEIYHGIEDIPKEHKVFALPRLSIREQMAAYKEVIDRSSLAAERKHPETGREER